jgi:hypothetical protein
VESRGRLIGLALDIAVAVQTGAALASQPSIDWQQVWLLKQRVFQADRHGDFEFAIRSAGEC